MRAKLLTLVALAILALAYPALAQDGEAPAQAAQATKAATESQVRAPDTMGTLVSLGIGVFVSLIQTVTSVQEMTLTFVPKLVGVSLIIVVAGSWMLTELTSWVTRLWTSIPQLT